MPAFINANTDTPQKLPRKIRGLPERDQDSTVYMVKLAGRWLRVRQEPDSSTFVVSRGARNPGKVGRAGAHGFAGL